MIVRVELSTMSGCPQCPVVHNVRLPTMSGCPQCPVVQFLDTVVIYGDDVLL